MAFYTYEIDQISKNDWHQLLLTFKDASIDQSRSYAEARWPRASLSHLVVKHNHKVVAAAQIAIRRVPFVRLGVAHVKFGPLWQPVDQTTNPDYLKQILNFLREEYVVKRGLLLRLMPPPLKSNVDNYCNLLQRNGFQQSAIVDCDRYFVDLSLSIEALRKNLKPRWRNHLNRASKQDLAYQWLDGEKTITTFMSLYSNMVQRKLFLDTSAITDLPKFYADLNPELKPKILICYAQGVPVSGAVISIVGDTAQYLFGATCTKGLELNAGYFVQWEVIKYLHNQNITWYDLGGNIGNVGLHQFKSGLIGKNGVKGILPGEFDCCECVLSQIVATTGFKLREWLNFALNYSWQT